MLQQNTNNKTAETFVIKTLRGFLSIIFISYFFYMFATAVVAYKQIFIVM